MSAPEVGQEQPAGGDLLPPAFSQDPAAYLASVAAQPTSRQALSQLAGPVAAWIANPGSNLAFLHLQQPAGPAAAWIANPGSNLAFLYLQAAAKQLIGDVKVGDVEQEMIRAQQQYEILEAVGRAATQCQSHRMSIASSGIIATLGHLMLDQPNILSHAGVEFLQCCLLAEHYRYAARLLSGSRSIVWPRPTATVGVKQVLRYYYLRGLIHLGCDDLELAHRCFWTCLSVPSEVSSKIAVEAWKKLVLVQCLLHDSTSPSSSITLPKSIPNCLGRMLASYRVADQQNQQQNPRQSQQSTNNTQQIINPITCYMDLSKAFYARDKAAMEKLEREHMTTITHDGNLGLMHQCQTRLVACQVAHLARMYSVVPLSKLAASLQVEESKVTSILCQSKVPCQILQENGMVSFEQDSSSSSHNTGLSSDISEWMQLMEKIQKLDVSIATSTKYHALARKDSSDKAGAAAGPRGVEDV